MSGNEMQTQLAKPYNSTTTQAKAIAYLTRTGNADLLPILGLIEDPAATGKQKDKAMAMFGGRPVPDMPRGYDCAICLNPLPAHGICRRSARCRKVSGEFEDQRGKRSEGGDR